MAELVQKWNPCIYDIYSAASMDMGTVRFGAADLEWVYNYIVLGVVFTK